jgi:hypothetical protein
MLTPKNFSQLYQQYVAENYYGGSAEPITPEHFKEAWKEMTLKEKTKLFERATER